MTGRLAGDTPGGAPAEGSGDHGAEGEGTLAAPERILRAARHCLLARGADGVTLQAVARAAGVSKGLVLYHFTDKETLLARLAERLAAGVVARERAALGALAPGAAIETMWEWLAGELARGDVRALVALAQGGGEAVRRAARRAGGERRAAAAASAAALFSALGLRPRVPPPLLAEVMVAFVDGLALDVALAPDKEPRVAFDVFWLSLLSLAE